MRADSVVIGGGIIGCAIARELARRGLSVALVEPRNLAAGATGASAGMLVPYVEAPEHGPLLDLGIRSLSVYDQFVAGIREETGADFEYARNGSIQVALREDPVVPMQNAATLHQRAGVAAEWLDETDLRELEPHVSTDVVGGLLIRPHAHVAAPALARALWASAAARGAAHVSDRATGIARDGNGLAVVAAGGRIAAGSVVLAAGCWGGQVAIEGASTLPVRPIRGQLVEVRWPRPPLHRILWGPRCYIVPWQNGTGLIGATVEDVGYDERNTVAGVWDLIEAASNLLPAAWRASFVEARAGLRPDTPDQLPVIGASQRLPGLVYATGHYRNGVLLAPITAMLVADLIVDRKGDPILDPLSPGRFGG